MGEAEMNKVALALFSKSPPDRQVAQEAQGHCLLMLLSINDNFYNFSALRFPFTL